MKLIREEWGAAAVEYAVLLGCVSLLLVVVLTQIGNGFSRIFHLLADVFAG